MNRTVLATIGLVVAFLLFLSAAFGAKAGTPGGGVFGFIAAGLFLFISLAMLAAPTQDEKPSPPQGEDSNHHNAPT